MKIGERGVFSYCVREPGYGYNRCTVPTTSCSGIANTPMFMPLFDREWLFTLRVLAAIHRWDAGKNPVPDGCGRWL